MTKDDINRAGKLKLILTMLNCGVKQLGNLVLSEELIEHAKKHGEWDVEKTKPLDGRIIDFNQSDIERL